MEKVGEGYKITELGEIPNTWKVKNLEDISELIDGDRSSKYPGNKDIVDSGILFLSTQNIVNSKLIYDASKFITKEKFDELNKGKLKKNDLVMTLRGSIGNIAKFNADKYDTGFINAQLMIIRSNKIDPNYLHKYLISPKSQNQITNISSGSAQPQLTKGELKKLKVIIPSNIEQEKIALILSTVDEQIDNVYELIEKNKELKKGLIQQLLTKGIGHTKFKKTDIGEIPEEWDVVALANITQIITKGTTPMTYGFTFEDEGINFIKVENIDGNGKILTEKLLKISEECNAKLSRSEICENDILMSIAGSLGRTAIVEKNVLPANTNQALAIIRIKHKEVDVNYVNKALSSPYIERNINKISTVGAQPNLSLKQVGEFKIAIPSIEEQKKISSILSKVDEKIEEYQIKKQKLKELKNGLMQQLLTGNIRVI